MAQQLITLVTRTCFLCGEEESTSAGKTMYYLPTQLPCSTVCSRCQCNSLLPDSPKAYRVVQPEPVIDWKMGKPKIGRPTRAMIDARKKEEQKKGIAIAHVPI